MISIPGKIPIRIHSLFWVLIFFIGWINSGSLQGTLIWAIVILVSILIHEYGHALTALAFGQKAEIDLIGLGGLTRRRGRQIKHWQEFLVVLNGPCAGFVLFFLVYQLQPLVAHERLNLIAYALKVAIYVNLFWNILNLLPILPLDGGHLLRITLESLFGINGTKFALLVSIGLSTIISLVFFLGQAYLAGALFLMFAFEGYRSWTHIKATTPQDTYAHLHELLQEGEKDLQAGRQHEAFSKFLLLRDQAKKGLLFIKATEHIARLLAQQGQYKQAYEWLLPIENQLSSDYLRFLQQLAYRLQEWEQTVKVGKKAYQQEPMSETALLNALACAIMGQAKPAVGWLHSAIQAGLPNIAEVIRKREFDAIRESSEFQALIRKYLLT